MEIQQEHGKGYIEFYVACKSLFDIDIYDL